MVIAAIVGYLLGSIPTAVIVGHFANVDPRTRGDGNPGWWNMRRLVGDRLAAIVLVGDFAKGSLAVVVGSILWGPWWIAYVAAFFALIGHAWPVFARFHGGRAACTLAGVLAVLAPAASLLSLIALVVTLVSTRRVSVGAVVGVVSIVLFQTIFQPASEVALVCCMLGFVGSRFLFMRRLSPAMTALT
jgi:acyl phosphate:glycerol-3-phosphate acyltransferase